MADGRDPYQTPVRPTLWLAFGFAILIAVGLVTVMMPEVQDEPGEESGTSQGDDHSHDQNDKAPQE